MSRSTMRRTLSTFGRLNRVRLMMETCCSTLGEVVIPDSNGFKMLWVST